MVRGSCITLIGMPASGKSTVGVVLAKRLGYQFLDGDLLIQKQTGKLLSQLIEELGNTGFRELENQVHQRLSAEKTVIAPGGSIIYGPEAMENLRRLGTIVYLQLSYPALRRRLGDLKARGVSMEPGQSLQSLYRERVQLYQRYADFTVEERGKSIRRVVEEIVERLPR